MTRPDHYNQAVLLECGTAVDVACMRDAVAQLLDGHPSLRTAYGSDAGGRIARLTAGRRLDTVSVSTVPDGDEAAVERHIEQQAQAAQETIALADGRLFHAHVFKCDSGADQLLLVAHHVAVDVISWRILVADLSRLYANLQSGTPAPLPPHRHSFWDWAGHFDKHRPALQANAAAWLAGQPANTEGAARTVWLGFTRAETAALVDELPAAVGAPFHVILLAAFALVVACYQRTTRLVVDVESHGRVVCDDDIDISRVVGWHTSTYPLALPVNQRSLRDTVSLVAHAMSTVPDLGVAYGLEEAAANRHAAAQVSAPVCFNYLGHVNFGHEPRFALQLSKYAPGRARADANHRGHALKFAARLCDGQLVADLSFPDHLDEEDMRTVMAALKSELMTLMGRPPAPAALPTETGTRTGLITYVPRQLLSSEDPPAAQRAYHRVLLNGAAGYLGIHVLMELLQQSQARVVCLVRGRDGTSAAQRLRAAVSWYFPGTPLATFGDRVRIIEADVAQPRLGLAPQLYDELSASIDAVYHFAADTRLFGQAEDFRRNNVLPVQACIDFAQQRRPKDLHYMSTLAVCGVNPGPEPVVFSEDALDVGQSFQNFYESSKCDAERLVHQFRMTGQRGFIYRSGNVAAHSRTGRFQRNAQDNRFVQFLAACVKVGKLPRDCGEPMVFSPIDEVAAGIVAISLHPALQGGTFHVDSVHETPMRQVFDALMEMGVPLEESGHPTFASLFRAAADSADPDVALGYFWAMRPSRNVRFSHARTHQLLHELGRGFRQLDAAWLRDVVRALAEQGVFGAAATTEEPFKLQA